MLLVPMAWSADFDPELTWRTITTDHFEISFHQGEEQLADEMSGICEDVYGTMQAEVAWTPKARTQLVLLDRTDSANGYAFTVPYNGIVLYVTAPQEDSVLGFYEDWSSAILTHELTSRGVIPSLLGALWILAFLVPLITVLAILAFPLVVVAIGSQREAEEARIAKAIRGALTDEDESGAGRSR